MIVGLLEIDGAGDFRVHGGAAELFGRIFLSDGGFDQRGPGEEEAAALGHEDVIGHNREIGAAGDAHAHDGGDLRDAHGGHARVVAEDAAEVVLVGEDVFLQRQKNAGGVDEIEGGDGFSIAMCCARRTFLAVMGKKAPAFTVASLATIIAETAGDAAEAADDAGGGRAAPFLVHAKCGEQRPVQRVRCRDRGGARCARAR